MTVLIHVSLIVIAIGALTTHFFGINGSLTLREGEAPVSSFNVTDGPSDGRLPFGISLTQCIIDHYPGTTTPMDFRSMLAFHISDSGDTICRVAAMNRVATFRHWRFYQSGIAPGSSTLSVAYDPWGIPLTYAGYALLTAGLIGFLFQKRSAWKTFARKALPAAAITIAALSPSPLSAAEASVTTAELPTMQRPLAKNFGKIFIQWNGRICPLQTMARDFTIKLYGKDTYRGLTAEQVTAGWLFHYDRWLADLNENRPQTSQEARDLAKWVGSGAAFKIYPYLTANNTVEWLSLCERRPSKMELRQWIFMQTSMEEISRLLAHGKNIAANDAITRLIDQQRHYAPEGTLPSSACITLERFYNSHIRLIPAAIVLFLLAATGIALAIRYPHRPQSRIITAATALATLYTAGALAIRGYVGGHMPMANGHETMLTMAVISLIGAILINRHTPLLKASLTLVGALALTVAAMAEKSPQIAHLTPVLSSTWLSVHVLLIMASYSLCLLMSIMGAAYLISSPRTTNGQQTRRTVTLYNRTILYPATALLALGIMAGAVWANQTWGRYWGWDPKETCALITLAVYALPLHLRSLPLFRRPTPLNLYLLLAILAVAFTYFGANYLLPGLHSYA